MTKETPFKIPKFIPETEQEKQMEQYAIKLMDLRKQIEDEMKPFCKPENSFSIRPKLGKSSTKIFLFIPNFGKKKTISLRPKLGKFQSKEFLFIQFRERLNTNYFTS